MLTNTRAECFPHLTHMSEFAASSFKQIMDAAESMKNDCDVLPDDLQPFGQELNEIIMRARISSYVESLKLISELGLQEIAREALPPKHLIGKE